MNLHVTMIFFVVPLKNIIKKYYSNHDIMRITTENNENYITVQKFRVTKLTLRKLMLLFPMDALN